MAQIERPVSWKLQELGMSNMNFFTTNVIQFVSGTITTFSQGDGTKAKSKQFSEFATGFRKITSYPLYELFFGGNGCSAWANVLFHDIEYS